MSEDERPGGEDRPRLADVLADLPPAEEAPPAREVAPAKSATEPRPMGDGSLPRSGGDRLQKLERLARLRDRGALTDEEFERAKAKVLRGG